MIETIETTNYIFAILGITTFLAGTILIVDLYTSKSLEALVRRFGIIIAFLMSAGVSAATLLYSEVFGFIPCGLCWLQRIALFPQVPILGTAIYYKDAVMPRYGIVLSSIGLVVGLYHHYLQMGGAEFIKCPAAGEGAACSQRFLFEFGFVTFPLLSVFVFAFLISLYFYLLKIRAA